MTLEFIVYCLMMMFIWLGLVPLFTGDNVRVYERSGWRALGLIFAFWLLQQLLHQLIGTLFMHATWPNSYQPFRPIGSYDASSLILTVLIGGLALWLIGRLRHFRMVDVTSFGWAIGGAAIAMFLSLVVDRWALPLVMPHIYHFINALR